ncbi:MAG TPA: DNA-binding protein [Deltaproteobacteria bacterium]|nr:DNA-binding protein [Deltaproteobacteria bacterium]
MENNPTTKNVFDKLKSIESLLVATQPKPLTLKEAAEFLDFSRSYLYRLTSQGRVPCYKPEGKRIYFDRAELVNWLKRNRIRPQEELEATAANYVVNH